ncbi:hypothetical protein AC1031_008339 [Aphanomyces cochlioides]|nr:hypothetical protein AC1031_008339 [Aphanomyces cochlioides]
MFVKSAIVAAFAVFLVWLLLPVTQFSGDHGEIIPGQNVIVTGASQGIGRALAFEYAKHGAAEIVITSRSGEKLTVVKEKVNELYPNTTVHVIPADLSSEENSKDFVVAALTVLNQKLDVLVLNHIMPSPFGYWLQSPYHHSVLSQILHTNAFSHIWIATAIVEAIAPRGSTLQIGVVGSLASQMGTAKGAAYSTSKHAFSVSSMRTAQNCPYLASTMSTSRNVLLVRQIPKVQLRPRDQRKIFDGTLPRSQQLGLREALLFRCVTFTSRIVLYFLLSNSIKLPRGSWMKFSRP